MPSLQDIALVNENLKKFNKESIEALHKFIFHDEGNRLNRQHLRQFEGFDYDVTDERYLQKCAYVENNLSIADLTSSCMILGVNYESADLKLHLFNNLRKGKLLEATGNDETDEQGDDDDDAAEDAEVESIGGTLGNSQYDDAASMLTNHEPLTRDTKNDRNGSMVGAPRFAMNMRDIEDAVRPFDGSDKMKVESWVEEFEETAEFMRLDEFQKLIFAKKRLHGVASLFVKSERGMTSWPKLRGALLQEFATVTNSAQLHKQLSERKLKKGEDIQEYYFNMKEVAARGGIDNDSLMSYIIDGINDLSVNKAILYGAKNLRDFKGKLKTYELIRAKFAQQTESNNSTKKLNTNKNDGHNTKQNANNKMELSCYNCGMKGHLSNNCKNKAQGKKCFNCNKFGHISKDCPENKQSSNCQYVASSYKNMNKQVIIGNLECLALFDTGSKFNIISDKLYEKLQKPKLSTTEVELVGIGEKRSQNTIKPIGVMHHNISIDSGSFNLEFLVISSKCIDLDMIIGQELCKYAKVTINTDGIFIKKNDSADKVMNVTIVINENDELNIDHTASKGAQAEVREIISNYKPERTKTTNIEMTIVLNDETPISSSPRRLPFSERCIVDEQIEEWKREGVIEDSNSEFTSPIVLVRKKDGGARVCVDYRRLNKVMVKDHFPLPLIEDQLDRLQEARIFSVIDLKNAFFHVPVAESSRKYTSFVIHNGQYQFCKVPFGLSNSPSVFQRHINAIFRDLTRRGVALPYVDDIIIPGKDENEAIKNLREVINIAKEYGLVINFKKCQFLMKKVEFLGHVIENKKISPARGKVDAVRNFKVPKTLKQLLSFLGLTGYFRKFVTSYSLIAKPLTDLTKQNVKFKMGPIEIEAFNTLKKIITEKPVLNMYNETYETEVHTDASMDGFGAVLLQRSPDDNNLHPVYYMSKKTCENQRKFSSYELEILAIVEALKKFRIYLLGKHFKLVTDCDAITKTLEKKDLCARVARWFIYLQEFDYTIEHRTGTRMKHVDCLSRYPFMLIDDNQLTRRIKQAQDQDEELKVIKDICAEKKEFKDYFLKNEILYKLCNDDELIVVPKGMQREVIKRTHERGHFAVRKTKELLCKEFYIPKVEEKIQNHINCCVPCIMSNRKQGKMEGELHPLFKGDTPLHTYHIDFLGPLESTSKKYKHILVIVDAFSKFCWLYPTKTTSTNEVLNKLKLQSINFGNPAVIISDRGSAFTAKEFESYCEAENIKHQLITTGLPRVNGQVERLNGVISSVLSKLSVNDPAKWYQHVSKVQVAINSSYSRSINSTPFEVMVGIKMRTKDDLNLKELLEKEFIGKFEDERNELRENAKQQIKKIQAENCKGYNFRRKPASQYNLGDLVAIKRTQFGGGLKLKAKYLGPYEITKIKGNNSYDVQKVGIGEGPNATTTCAEFMKLWCADVESDDVLGSSN